MKSPIAGRIRAHDFPGLSGVLLATHIDMLDVKNQLTAAFKYFGVEE